MLNPICNNMLEDIEQIHNIGSNWRTIDRIENRTKVDIVESNMKSVKEYIKSKQYRLTK